MLSLIHDRHFICWISHVTHVIIVCNRKIKINKKEKLWKNILLSLLMCFGRYFCFLFEKMFWRDIKVKTVLSVLCFRLPIYVFVLKRDNKREKEKTLTNKADFECQFYKADFECQFSVASLNSCYKRNREVDIRLQSPCLMVCRCVWILDAQHLKSWMLNIWTLYMWGCIVYIL